MKKDLLLTTSFLILLLFWPVQAKEAGVPKETTAAKPERLNTSSETNYLSQLELRGFNLDAQGLRIESLDGSTVLADHQSDIPFNPASVIKVATSFTALQRFGPEHRFETSFYSTGDFNPKTRILKGDLILYATGDPILTPTDVTGLIRQIIRLGVTRVTGNLIIIGPFTYGNYYATPTATKHLEALLRKMGVRVAGAGRGGSLRGTRLVSHTSSTLQDILFNQNAHSNNQTAERLGEAVGGPTAVEEFLVKVVGIPAADVHVGRASGLDYNRITPRDTVQLFRELVRWLEARHLEPENILPVAGVDPGTLHRRFRSDDYRGAIVGKTGTLPSTDGGVSTLAGILYTRDRGPVVFAIFNTKGSVSIYRKLQDNLLQSLILECGGIPLINASSRRSNN